MKKIIASAVVAAATLSASQAAVFNGYSAGFTAGTLTSKNHAKADFRGESVAKKNLNKTFGSYGIHFDYDRSAANAFYWGLGVDLMFFSGKKSATVKENRDGASGELKRSAKYSWSSELDARLGYNFCNNVASYALAGLRFQRKHLTISGKTITPAGTTLYSGKDSHTRAIPVLGAGFKAKVTSNLSAGVEYRYAFEDSRKFATTNGDFKDKWKQSSHAALAKVSYHF